MSRIIFFLLGTILIGNAHAQFSKYRSKTKYARSETTTATSSNVTTAPVITEQPPQAKAPTTVKKTASKKNSPTNSMVENETAVTGVDAFGRPIPSDTSKPSENSPYVTLNPETAYGPEVITSFDFPDADILEVTRHMQKLTGLNLILDRDVKGKISISAPTPITVGDAWKAYISVLTMNGFAITKSGAFYKIIKNRDLKNNPAKIYTGNFTPDTESYVMRVIPLRHIKVSEVKTKLQPLLTGLGKLLDIEQTNTLIVYDTGVNINHIAKLMDFLDIPGYKESLQFIKVQHTSAQEIAKLLDSILRDDSRQTTRYRPTAGNATQSQNTKGITKIIAEPRTNSIIAMANADGAQELRELIAKLDVKLSSKGSDKVHVYYLNHGNAEELSKTLSSLISGQVASGGTTRNQTRFSGRSSIEEEQELFNAEVKVTADKSNNAMVVTASPTDWITLKNVIAKLDIPRDQVYVEGLIMETNVNKYNEFGISVVGAYGTGAAQKAGVNAPGIVNLLSNNIQSLGGLFVGGGTGKTRTVDIGGSKVEVNSVNALIRAVATDGNTNILATPQVLAINNEEATFEVGEEVPVPEQSTTASNITTVTSRQQQVTMSIKITPNINKTTRFVKLKIEQKIKDFSSRPLPETLQNSGVGTTVRNILTTVIVRDKDTISMGGLMRDKQSDEINKVPLLGDIPVLGWLFKSRTKKMEKVNLLFFMTPRILASYEETASQTTKDALNRRSAHLKNIHGGDDPFASTVKGLYKKVQAQEKGPLFEQKSQSETGAEFEGETTLYQSPEQIEALDRLVDQDEPNYLEITKGTQQKRIPASLKNENTAEQLKYVPSLEANPNQEIKAQARDKF